MVLGEGKMKYVFDRIAKFGCWIAAAVVMLGICVMGQPASADELPGEAKTVTPGYEGFLEGLFQSYVVQVGLERLGYEVNKTLQVHVSPKFLALAQRDVDFIADGWFPTQESFYQGAGGDGTLTKVGKIVENATSGYFVDKETAEKYGITSITQLTDPAISELFDIDGNGKANLYGCPQGWGCEQNIEHQLDAYELRGHVEHTQGEIAFLAADIVSRYRQGEPVLFFAYAPNWLSQVLAPGVDVEYLEVPFTALPEIKMEEATKTTLPDGRNIGHQLNDIWMVANNEFLAENPAARRFFELVKIPIEDVNAENYMIFDGDNTSEDVRRHAEEWVSWNRGKFNSWIEEAMNAAR